MRASASSTSTSRPAAASVLATASPTTPAPTTMQSVDSIQRLALDAEQLDIEDQRGVRRNEAAGAAVAIAEFCRNDQGALAADLHGGDALIPARDDTLHADRKFERGAAIDRTVELLALRAIHVEPAGVVHDAGLPGARRRAGADRAIDILQARRRGDGLRDALRSRRAGRADRRQAG